MHKEETRTLRGNAMSRQTDKSDAATKQGTPGTARAGRGKEESEFWRLQREHGPAHTLILDFWPPELG